MKNTTLSFTPGGIIPPGQKFAGHERQPHITLPDGSAIMLSRFDPACGPRQHKRRAKRLPTIDTRNEMGALFAAAPELLDMLTEARGELVDLNQSENDNGAFLARLDAAIHKATQTQ